jgi:hypothetical protein
MVISFCRPFHRIWLQSESLRNTRKIKARSHSTGYVYTSQKERRSCITKVIHPSTFVLGNKRNSSAQCRDEWKVSVTNKQKILPTPACRLLQRSFLGDLQPSRARSGTWRTTVWSPDNRVPQERDVEVINNQKDMAHVTSHSASLKTYSDQRAQFDINGRKDVWCHFPSLVEVKQCANFHEPALV